MGLAQLEQTGRHIYRANPSAKWPGEATLEVAQVWITNADFNGQKLLESSPVNYISSSLTSDDHGEPIELTENGALITPARKFRMLLHTNPTRERGECLGTRAGALEDM